MKAKQGLKFLLWMGIIIGIIVGCYSVLPQDKIDPISLNSQPQFTPSPALISAQIDPINRPQLWSHIQALTGERFQDSDRENVRNYLIQQLELFHLSPSLQSFDQGVNIVAEHLGTNPKAGTILLAAHYDTVPNSAGADDNASGVAVILEIARLFAQKNTPRSLKIVFFDQEEVGLLGSFAFTEKPENLKNLQAAIILDMVGYACHLPGCQTYPPGLTVTPILEAAGIEFPDRGEFLTIVGEIQHLPLLKVFQIVDKSLRQLTSNFVDFPPLVTIPIPLKGLVTPDVLRSDHAPFWYQEIPAVLITDTANLRSPHYHQPSDTISNLDPKFFEGSAEIIYNVIAELLNSQTPFILPD
ncbi:MAG TPA: peptidase M28 [Planktothrix sp. UBA8402]|nr:peptidase M28 [Planktothrix sp. UBA8402]